LEERGLDFELASEVFEGLTLEVEDDRHDASRRRTPRVFDEEMQ
jgi:hypothetical protein